MAAEGATFERFPAISSLSSSVIPSHGSGPAGGGGVDRGASQLGKPTATIPPPGFGLASAIPPPGFGPVSAIPPPRFGPPTAGGVDRAASQLGKLAGTQLHQQPPSKDVRKSEENIATRKYVIPSLKIFNLTIKIH